MIKKKTKKKPSAKTVAKAQSGFQKPEVHSGANNAQDGSSAIATLKPSVIVSDNDGIGTLNPTTIRTDRPMTGATINEPGFAGATPDIIYTMNPQAFPATLAEVATAVSEGDTDGGVFSTLIDTMPPIVIAGKPVDKKMWLWLLLAVAVAVGIYLYTKKK